MTPEIDIRRIKNPRDVKEVLSKTIEACRKANGIRTSEIIGTMVAFPSLTRMVCRLNPATNILMTNTSPYRFSSVRAIFLFTKKFLGGEAVDQLCERLRIISAISKHTSTQSTTPPKPAEPVL